MSEKSMHRKTEKQIMTFQSTICICICICVYVCYTAMQNGDRLCLYGFPKWQKIPISLIGSSRKPFCLNRSAPLRIIEWVDISHAITSRQFFPSEFYNRTNKQAASQRQLGLPVVFVKWISDWRNEWIHRESQQNRKASQ